MDLDLPSGSQKTGCNAMCAAHSIPPAAGAPMKDAVLLVDDEQPLLDVFRAALSSKFEITTANTAREADLILHKKAFKVVVADHLMPGGNGMNFLTRAREDFPHMQRILVTGYMKPEMLLRSVNEAALFRYLLKPVAIAELISVVTDAAKAHDASVAAASKN
jgi:two-component system response regulator HupR/HoxA